MRNREARKRDGMKIFYHNDMDGKCAANVIGRSGNKLTGRSFNYPKLDMIPMDYGLDFPIDRIETDEKIYIVDFSIEPQDMLKLLEITKNVTWIDHHDSAIRKYVDFPHEIDGLRNIDHSGCVLAWKHIHPDASVPEYIILIGDRDTWQWKYGDRTKFFFAGIEAEDTDPKSMTWCEMQRNPDKFVDQGVVIQKYKDRTQQEYIRDCGFWIQFEGHKCYAINGRFSSQPISAVAPKADIWMPFRYMPKGYWMVCLYSETVEVNKIAERFSFHGEQGGGHKGAAGFECHYPPFLTQPDSDEVCIS